MPLNFPQVKAVAYHQILRELLADLKTLEATWVSETLEAQTSPLSSPSPQSSQEQARPFTHEFWQLAEASLMRKERGETVLGEVGLS